MLKGLSCEQENSLQKFKLSEPVLCIGGYLQIELLGRVQKQEMDGLYYIWLVLHKEANIFLYSCVLIQPIGTQVSLIICIAL